MSYFPLLLGSYGEILANIYTSTHLVLTLLDILIGTVFPEVQDK